MVGRDQGRRGYRRGLVDDGGLDVALNSLDCGCLSVSISILLLNPNPYPSTYINDSAQCSDSIGSVYHVASHGGILHNTTRDHNDIFCGVCQLLDDKVDHLSKGGIFILEQLRDAKEEGSCFIGGKLFTSEQKKGNLGQEDAASSWGDWGCVEYSSCCDILACYTVSLNVTRPYPPERLRYGPP